MTALRTPHAALTRSDLQGLQDSMPEPGETSGIRPRTGPPPEDLLRAHEGRARATDLLLRHMVEAEDGSGLLFYSPMKGRVIDTALTLHILQRNGIDADWQDRLKAFLDIHLADADVFSATVARSVLATSFHKEHGRDDPAYSAGLNRILQGLRHARKRKKALLGTILAEVSAIPFESAEFDPDLLSDEVAHLFSQIYFAALKIIHSRRAGADAATLGLDISFLADTQAPNGSWEQQSLLTLVALLALGPQDAAFARGLAFLRSMTREDGGVAFCDNLNLWTTALAGIALLDGRDLAREALHTVAEYIVTRQQPCGGWAFSERVAQTDTDTTAQCAQLLLMLDKDRYSAAIEAAHAHFALRQRPDGGYPTYEIAGESEATMTANIALIQAMSIDAHPEFRPRIESALSFICSHQSREGTFERSWSLSELYSIFRVSFAFHGCRDIVSNEAIEAARRRSAAYLIAAQRPDGGWGHTAQSPSDALSTSYALLTIPLLRPHVPWSRASAGLDYLLSQQDPSTGEIVSIPDVVGPRPIVFNIPLLATIFGAMALRAVGTP